ncbi:MAG: hypothetical protein M1816_004820 [Peltula sp. TS41687]|nr:MAG: hypothetical protein M1816_004820 [Peltula sp. TS41687]
MVSEVGVITPFLLGAMTMTTSAGWEYLQGAGLTQSAAQDVSAFCAWMAEDPLLQYSQYSYVVNTAVVAFAELFPYQAPALANSKLICAGARDLALELILALQSVPLSRALPFRIGRGTLLTDLFNIGSQIDLGEFDIRSIIPLFEKMNSHASDLEICNALFTLVARPATPPQFSASFIASFQQTPWSFIRPAARDVDSMLKAKMEDNLIIDHPEFFDTFSGGVAQLPEIATAIFEMCKDAEPPPYTENIGWTEWPVDCGESRVLNWLRRHIDQLLIFADRRGFRPLERR